MSSAADQREARRARIIARRSQGELTVPPDVAEEVTAANPPPGALEPEASEPLPNTDSTDDVNAAGKSSARLAAERRRSKILAKQQERLAAVTGDHAPAAAEAPKTPEDILEEEADRLTEKLQRKASAAESTAGSRNGSFAVRPLGGPLDASPLSHAQMLPPKRKSSAETGPIKRSGSAALNAKPFDGDLIRQVGSKDSHMTAKTPRRWFSGLSFWVRLEHLVTVVLLVLLGATIGIQLLPEVRLNTGREGLKPTEAADPLRSNLEAYLASAQLGGGQFEGASGGGTPGGESVGRLSKIHTGEDTGGVGTDSSGEAAAQQEEKGLLDGEDFVGSFMGQYDEESEGSEPRQATSPQDLAPQSSDHYAGSPPEVEAAEEDEFTAGDRARGWLADEGAAGSGGEGEEWANGVGGKWLRAAWDFLHERLGFQCLPLLVPVLAVKLAVAALFALVRVLLGYPMFVEPPKQRAAGGFDLGRMAMGMIPGVGRAMGFYRTTKSVMADLALALLAVIFTILIGMHIHLRWPDNPPHPEL